MAAYKKPTVNVSGVTLGGYSFSGKGEVYDELKAHRTAEIKGEENTVLIPFHAVKNYQKSVTSADAERTDAYCK